MHIYWNAPADEGDTEKQLRLYSSMQTKGFRGFIFAPDETLASRSLVLQTIKSGVPVVIVDDELGPPAGQLLSYVSNDEAAGAKLAANRISTLVKGQGSIAIIGINPRSEGGLSREEAFERALALDAPGVHVVIAALNEEALLHSCELVRETALSPIQQLGQCLLAHLTFAKIGETSQNSELRPGNSGCGREVTPYPAHHIITHQFDGMPDAKFARGQQFGGHN